MTRVTCTIGRRRFGARAYLKIGNEVSPSLLPITPKQMATFGKGFYNHFSNTKLACAAIGRIGRRSRMQAKGHLRMLFHMDDSLSPGHHGTIPCSPDHGEAAGPVGPAVGRILSFVSSVRAPFAPLATPSGDRPGVVPCQGGAGLLSEACGVLLLACSG